MMILITLYNQTYTSNNLSDRYSAVVIIFAFHLYYDGMPRLQLPEPAPCTYRIGHFKYIMSYHSKYGNQLQ